MGNFEIILLSQALKFYKKCPQDLAERLNQCFQYLETNPFFGSHIKLLKTKDRLYRYRVGNYRVIYEVDKEQRKVGIFLISLRPSAYRNL